MFNKKISKIISAEFQKMNDYDNRKELANKRNQAELAKLVEDINTILKGKNVNWQITDKQIEFTSDQIHNIFLQDKTFSNILFDSCFPKPIAKKFSHYTNFSAFTNIVSSNTIRLYNLHKNYTAGEFIEFYKDHKITGYNDKKKVFGMSSDSDTLMSEIFCFCLTEFGHDRFDTYKWRDFADFGKGVRIDFEINPHISEFRKIFYPNPPKSGIPLLNDLFSVIPAKYKLPINLTGMSKMGSYYIKNDLNTENEYRFLIKRTSEEYLARYLQPIVDKDKIAYINLAFNSPFADFKIVSVQPGFDFPNENIPDIVDLIKANSPGVTVLSKAYDFSKY